MSKPPQPGKRNISTWLFRVAILIALVILLWWALRDAPLQEIWLTVSKLRPVQVAALLTLNTFFYILATLRWWLIVEAENKHVNYWPLFRVRVSVFGVSYFTLGPQVGGETLQVFALRRKYGLTFTHATAAVLMDKLLEYFADFFLLAMGLTAVLQAGILFENGIQLTANLIALIFLIAWPPIHLSLLYNRHYPLTSALHVLPFVPKSSTLIRFLRASERLAGMFCQRHPRRLILASGISLVTAAAMVADYALMASFMGIHLTFWKTIAGWIMGWVSLLMPLPGGLGAMEASQVFVLGRFGYGPATALSLALLQRGRDILVGGLGLLLASREITR
jgi:glycosyltransferase 2 family protein